MLNFEEYYYKENKLLVAGSDEAGRGPVAGPLVVAACILPFNFNDELINDSKKLTPKKRDIAYDLIINHAIDYSIIIIDVKDIDKDANIYLSTKNAMIKAFNNLKVIPDLYLTDCMPLDRINDKEVISIVKGDSKSKNIAAASILAKVTRDRIMYEYDKKYPQYLFKNNKGYLTKAHNQAILKFGYIKNLHRESYEPIKSLKNK